MLKFIAFCIFLLLSNEIDAQNAQQKADKLKQGTNFSWLENYWSGNVAINYTNYLDYSTLPYLKTQLPVMKQYGFTTLRLPVCFSAWEDGIAPYTIDSVKYFDVIDSIVNWTAQQQMMLVIDFHHGRLSDANFNSELDRTVQLWKQVATHFAATDTNRILFEIYNEPNGLSNTNWQNAAQKIVDTIRSVAPHHTLIVGGADFNSIAALNNFNILSDNNIIYTFHFYEPFLFTHQGASWIGDAVSTVGIPYPGTSGTMPSINPLAAATWANSAFNYYPNINRNILAGWASGAKQFSITNNVPVWCGEWGSYGAFAPTDSSRCRYTRDLKFIMDSMAIPYAYWEWDGGFSFFDGAPPADNNCSPCMKTIWNPMALNILPKNDEQNFNAQAYANIIFINENKLQINYAGKVQTCIYSSSGLLLLKTFDKEISTQAFARGLYLIQCVKEGKLVYTQKLVL
jgi:endoglucanase